VEGGINLRLVGWELAWSNTEGEAIAFASVAPEGRSFFPLGERFASASSRWCVSQHFPAKDLEGFAIVSFKQWNDLS
jgi:hypothetical protein